MHALTVEDGKPRTWLDKHSFAACLLFQPSRTTLGADAQRIKVPVSRISRPSAKLDFPLPFRPTTSVSPGPGRTFSVAAGPIPRNPPTVSDCR
jgi:hypothetical protein